jgi:hypothetical protein
MKFQIGQKKNQLKERNHCSIYQRGRYGDGVLCKLEDIIRNKSINGLITKKIVWKFVAVHYTCEYLNWTFCQQFRSLILESDFKALLTKLV